MRIELKITGREKASDALRLMERAYNNTPKHVAEASAKALLTGLKIAVPKRSGSAAESMDYRMIGSGRQWHANFIGPDYLKWVIGGRRVVEAGIFTGRSNKKFLRFRSRGRTIFTRRVRASMPNDFRVRAVEFARPVIQASMLWAGMKIQKGIVE